MVVWSSDTVSWQWVLHLLVVPRPETIATVGRLHLLIPVHQPGFWDLLGVPKEEEKQMRALVVSRCHLSLYTCYLPCVGNKLWSLGLTVSTEPPRSDLILGVVIPVPQVLLPTLYWVTLDEALNLSKTQFPHLKWMDALLGYCRAWMTQIGIRCSAWYLDMVNVQKMMVEMVIYSTLWSISSVPKIFVEANAFWSRLG